MVKPQASSPGSRAVPRGGGGGGGGVVHALSSGCVPGSVPGRSELPAVISEGGTANPELQQMCGGSKGSVVGVLAGFGFADESLNNRIIISHFHICSSAEAEQK